MTPSYETAKRVAFAILADVSLSTQDQVEQAVKNAKMITPTLTEQEAQTLIKEIQAAKNIFIPEGSSLVDARGHVPWLSEKRIEISWDFWNRYAAYLELHRGMPKSVIMSLDRMTDDVLEKLENPKRAGTWDRRGMVVGQVQSGKTANYTGLICKAVDAGYKLIIVLAGVHNSLRSQTQLRLDEGFLGFDTKRNRAFRAEEPQIGAGKVPTPKRLIAHSLTSSEETGDFNTRIAHTIGVMIGGDPVILVMKKNKTPLENLLKYVKEQPLTLMPDGRKVLRDIPMLLIDDEADHASVDTNETIIDPETGQADDEQNPKKINGLIRQIVHTFDQSAYVGYTATPFANIFIYPHSNSNVRTYGEDLFPRSFIISLPAPSNYLGPVQVFGLKDVPDASIKGAPGLPIIREIKDSDSYIPAPHKKDLKIHELPASLHQALKTFIITCAARAARGQVNDHNSMLVHVTRFTDVQKQVRDIIDTEIRVLRQRLQNGDGDRIPSLKEELKDLWESDFVPTMHKVKDCIEDPLLIPVSWEEVEPCLAPAASKIELRLINGAAADILDYYGRPNGINVVAIGGDKLSRGLTLEGLSVSYYLRGANMYDTLMQMGRWFGYRPGYADLCRLYTTEQIIGCYSHITVASEELRQEFDRMFRLGRTPEEYGLRVRTHPGGLLITALNKMRTGTPMRVSFHLTLAETSLFAKDPAVISRNFDVAEEFLKNLGTPSSEKSGDRYWHDVDGAEVAEFLGSMRDHPLSRANPDRLRDYILKKLPHKELTHWTVVLCGVQNRTSGSKDIAGMSVGLSMRTDDESQKQPKDPQTYALIRRHLLSAGDEEKDLNDTQRTEALQKTKEAWQADPRGRPEPKAPSGLAIRDVRPKEKGLLLIYLLDPKSAFKDHYQGPPFVAYAVSFPNTAVLDTAAEYMVTKIYND